MKRLILLLLLCLVVLSPVVYGQEPPSLPVAPESPSGAQESSAAQEMPMPSQAAGYAGKRSTRGGEDASLFYAYLGDVSEESPGPVAEAVIDKLFPGKKVQSLPLGNPKYRPGLQWRHWANQKQRFWPALIFCLSASSILWIPFGRRFDAAGAFCRRRFWRSLFAGVAVSILAVFLARLMFLSEIGWPLGILLIAITQLALVMGLVVSINLIGEAIATALHLARVSFIAERPVAARILFLFIGSLVLSAVILIPGPMHLPPVGTRIIMLIAGLGLGGLYNSRTDNRTS